MHKKFVPASTKALSLGIIHGTHFSVAVSPKSGFDDFEKYTNLPCLHLTVAADNEAVTWSTWDQTSEKIGTVVSIVRRRRADIVKYFFGEQLAPNDAGVRIELDDELSARRQTAHFYLAIGHKDLFGENGLVRQCEQSLLKPELIAEEVIENASKQSVVWCDHAPPDMVDP